MTEQTDVDNFLLAIEPEQAREDCQALTKIIEDIVGEPPKMWGKMVGCGSYHYVYESGREGDTFKIGFAPRKGKFTLYLQSGFDIVEEEMETLGKHKRGKSCLHIKKMSDIDIDVLKTVLKKSVVWIEEKYPA